VVYEPHCLIASPVCGRWRDLMEFARRQFLITRVYAPGLWWGTLLNTALHHVTFWGSLVLTAVSASLGRPWGWSFLLLAAIYGLQAHRARLRQRAVARRFPDQQTSLRPVAWLDVLAHPLLSLGHLLVLLSSAFGRVITWRGIRYRLHSPRHTEILSRPEPRNPGELRASA